jgi:hypothetical protein
LKLRNRLQFKCDLEKNILRNLTLASNVNLRKHAEIVKHSMVNHKSALSHLRSNVEIQHSNILSDKFVQILNATNRKVAGSIPDEVDFFQLT